MFTQSVKLEKKKPFQSLLLHVVPEVKIVFITQENYIVKSIEIDNYSYVFFIVHFRKMCYD